MMIYKTISLWQPYATFIAMGIKQYETRSWHPGRRIRPGEILMIHAAKRPMSDYEKRLMKSKPLEHALAKLGLDMPREIPYGAIVAAVKFKDALPTNYFKPVGIEKLLGNYSPDRYAWELELVKPAIPPIPASGKQGIWYWLFESQNRYSV